MKFTWNEIDNYITDEFDLLITFASFEKRCFSLAQYIPPSKIKKAVIFYLCNNKECLENNLDHLREILDKKNKLYEIVELNHDKPIEISNSMVECLNKYLENDSINIIVDVTTFTHEALLILLMLLKYNYTKTKVSIAYSNAKEYDPLGNKQKRSSSMWLSKGIGDIRSILGYPGETLPTRQTHLIIIVGYEYDRALSIISDMEPTSLSLGFGKSDSYTTESHGDNKLNDKHFGAKRHFDEVARDSLSLVSKNRIYEFDISCNNPNQANEDLKLHLEDIKNEIVNKNILLFAMNNKLNTIGVGLYAFEHRDIQLCYAPALIYNYNNYSIPGSKCYLFKLW